MSPTSLLRLPSTALLLLVLAACTAEPSLEASLAAAKLSLAKNDAKAAVIQAKSALQHQPESSEGRLLLGQALLRSNDARGAEAELRRALEYGQAPAKVALPLAQSLLAQGEHKRLVFEFGRSELAEPAAQAELQTLLAVALLAQGQDEPAQQALVAALRADPQYRHAVLLQSRLKAGSGDVDGALKLVADMLSREPKALEAWMLQGELLWSARGDGEQALAAYRQAAELKPDSAPAQVELMAMLLRLGRLDDATAQLAPLRKAAPDLARARYLEALLALDKRDLKQVKTLLQPLLAAAPTDLRYLQLAGDVAMQLGELPQAQTYLEGALEQAPQSALVRRMLAGLYLRNKQTDKALAAIKPLLEASTPDAATLMLAGDLHRQTGEVKKAEAFFARAAKLSPQDSRAKTSLALAHLAGGQSALALSSLRQAATDSSDSTADMALIAAHVTRGEIDQALVAIEALQKKQPDKPFAANLRGRALLAKGDREGARRSFDQALAIDPLFYPAADGLAAMDLAEKKPDAARQRFEDLIKRDPKHLQALLALANLQAMTGAPKKTVEESLARAVAAAPTQRAPRLQLVDWHLRQGELPQALAAAREGLSAMPGSPDLLDALGRVQLAGGDHQQAIVSYKQLSGQQAQSVLPLLRLAQAQRMAKDPAAAGDSLRKALALQADLLEAQTALASLAMEAKNPAAALALARTVQQQRPKQAIGYQMEAEVAVAQKQWAKAVAAYEQGLKAAPSADLARRAHAALGAAGDKAALDRFAENWLKQNPKDALFRLYLGDVAAARKDYVGAEKHYSSVIRLQPNHPAAYNNLAYVSGRMGKTGALALAERAVALAPAEASYMDTLAMLLTQQKAYAKAIEWQKKVVALQPQNAVFRLNLARILILDGQKAPAKQELTTLAKLGDKFGGQAEVNKLLSGL